MSAKDAPPVINDGEAQLRTVRGFKWAIVVIAILSSTFLFALDNTVVADIQPAIIERFDSLDKLPWASVAFLLGVIATILLWGRVYGLFNAKWLYIGTTLLFEIGSAICGAAPTMDALIVGRAIAGVGGAGMYVGVMTLLSVTTTMQERPLYLSFTGLTWGLGTVLGPVIGGAFADSSVGWRFAFYINLFIGAVFAPVYFFMLPSYTPRSEESSWQKLKTMDWVGLVFMVGTLGCLVSAISMGGNVWSWGSGSSIALFVVAGVLLVIFCIQQYWAIFTTPQLRLFPIQFLKQPVMLILFACCSSAAASLFSPIYFIPLFFQFTRGDSAIDAAVRLLPFIILLVVFVIVNGIVLSKYGVYWPWYLFGGILVVIGGALMYADVSQTTPNSNIYGYSILIGIGAGCFVQTSFSVAQARSTPEEAPSAIGFISFAQSLGATISLAIANSLFLNRSNDQLHQILPGVSDETIRGVTTGTNVAYLNSLAPQVRSAALDAIVDATNVTYVLTITAGALVVVLSLLMPKERLFMAPGGGGA